MASGSSSDPGMIWPFLSRTSDLTTKFESSTSTVRTSEPLSWPTVGWSDLREKPRSRATSAKRACSRVETAGLVADCLNPCASKNSDVIDRVEDVFVSSLCWPHAIEIPAKLNRTLTMTRLMVTTVPTVIDPGSQVEQLYADQCNIEHSAFPVYPGYYQCTRFSERGKRCRRQKQIAAHQRAEHAPLPGAKSMIDLGIVELSGRVDKRVEPFAKGNLCGAERQSRYRNAFPPRRRSACNGPESARSRSSLATGWPATMHPPPFGAQVFPPEFPPP